MQKIGSCTDTADENGEFTDGDPQTQVSCTWVMAAWLNTLQRELIHLCEEAGITIDPNDDTQVYQAISALINGVTDELGTASSHDITTSFFDTVLGHVLKVGDYGFGIGNGSSELLTSIYDITCTGIYNVMGKGTQSPTEGVPADSGNTRYSAFALNVYDGQYWVALFSSTEFYIGQVRTTDNTSSWSRYYNTNFKQTAADTGAMPYFGTALNVDLNTLGAYGAAGVHYQPQNGGATTANHYPVAEAGALLVLPSAYGCQQLYITFGTGRVFSRGLSGPWNGTNGPWGNWNEPYSPTNPNEIVSTSANSFRIAYNGYGTFWRNDGINFYLMLTNNGDPHGNYNSLRPFRVNVATGEAVMHKLNLEDFGYFDARYQAKGNFAAPDTSGISGGVLWWKNTATGIIRMIGKAPTTAAGARITFPFAFTTECHGVTMNTITNSGGGTALASDAVSTTGFNLHIAGGGNVAFTWVAEGI